MSPELLNLFQTSLIETLWMVGVSAALGTLLGLPIGVLLVVTDRQGLLEHLPFNRSYNCAPCIELADRIR